MADFDTALQAFIDGCNEIVRENDKQYDNVKFNSKVEADKGGRRYVRIVKSDAFSHCSAYCFVDKTNGDVLKPAGWKSPAKHARGNIYNDDNGLGCMGPYGPAYLR